VHNVTRRLFNWCVEYDLITHSPAAGIKAPHEETSRDRVLSDAELGAIWRSADGMFGDIVRPLILTGQRRNEVARMEWAELDLAAGLWTLPRERTKQASTGRRFN
jgi:integrase